MKNVLLGSLLVITTAVTVVLLTPTNVSSPNEIQNKVLVQVEPSPKPVFMNFSPILSRKRIQTINPPKSQIVFITGIIDKNSYSAVQQIQNLGKGNDEIFVALDSPGGSVIDGARIVSAMEASHASVTTVCLSMCASMAAIIHQYGHKRLMVDRSVLMFHNAAAGLEGPLPQMKTRLNFLERYVIKMDAYVAKKAGLSLEQFLNMFQNEMWIDAEDSLASHFSDGTVNIILDDSPAPSLPPDPSSGYVYFKNEK